jgi:2-polyprenyl-3-methyl-5-hydroxy-6-metoxy-1,4-benzoquinol methylase
MNRKGFNPAYVGQRPDIQKLIPYGVGSVLDVGCSNGALGASLKAKRKKVKVFGIEMSPEMAKVAAAQLDKVFVGDASEVILNGSLAGHEFDVIIFADLLEHLVDPWRVLKVATKHLKPGGSIITSIPNIRHIDTIYNLVIKGRWPYRDRGIHDRTHLRFFTMKNIEEMFENAGLQIDNIETNYRFWERGHKYNRYAKHFAIPGIKNFLAFQYLMRARKKN